MLLHRNGLPSAFMTIAASRGGVHRVMRVFNPSRITAFLASRSRYATALDS